MAFAHTLGVIGVGNMGAALVRGIVAAGVLPPESVTVFDAAPGRADALALDLGVQAAASNLDVAARSEYLLLAVKPGMVATVLREVDGALTDEQVVVSIAAGVTLSRLAGTLTHAAPSLVRVMPNTPALVGAGMLAVAAPGVPAAKVEGLQRLLAPLGRVVAVEESAMDAVTGLSGSGPAFVFVMIEALADGGVAAGLSRPVALELAAQTVLGGAKMVLETGQHPAALKDMVASPNGTTIAGLAALEGAGFRAALMAAVREATRRSHELSEGK
jgi:pyrroline-5-carboxylate reductase